MSRQVCRSPVSVGLVLAALLGIALLGAAL
jgi:hypothetical protein